MTPDTTGPDSGMPTTGRRAFLQAGGCLLVAFPFAGALRAQQDVSAGPPDPEAIDSWLAIHGDNTATLYIGFVELGQGCSTALVQIAAEELDLSMDQISLARQHTDRMPNQGGTYSSAAIHRGGPQIQRAAAEARRVLLMMAADALSAPAEKLSVSQGVISQEGNASRITYGELIGDQQFELPFSGEAPLKTPTDYRLVGTPIRRRDIAQKVSGEYPYLQHQRLEGMLHGRVVRPPGQGAYRDGIRIVAVDADSIAHIPASIVRQENFLAVLAEREWDAVRAARELRVEWSRPDNLPGNEALFERMENSTTNDRIAEQRGDVSRWRQAAVHSTFRATGPYQAHAPFAPNAALADVGDDSARILCASQDIYTTRATIAAMLGMAENRVRVEYRESSGTFGRSCWDDAAQAAALCSRLSGHPVRIQFMRHDEHGWDNYGPAHVGRVRVSADEDGNIQTYEYEGWQHHWSLIESTRQSAENLAAEEWPAFPAQQINPRVLGGMYRIPDIRLTNHHVPGEDYLKGAWLRSPLDLSLCFVSEQAIDDLAWQLSMDPWRFRQQNIADARWQGVLDAAAEAADWQTGPAFSNPAEGSLLRGRGIGLGTHLASWGAAVADLEVDRETGTVRILHLFGAIDAGRVVNTSNVRQQITGQLVQSASRMLKEEVIFNSRGVTSLDWDSYPILRFSECPEVTPVIVQRIEEASSGAGEEVMAAAAAAIANAFFDATGKRMQTYPFTSERVLSVLKG